MPQQHHDDADWAYQCIDNFFDCYHFHSAAQELDNIITAACSPDSWTVPAPAEQLFFTKQLGKLCKAAIFISGIKDKNPDAVLGKNAEIEWTVLLHEIHLSHSNVWQNFPRHLSAAQYRNPYKALKKIGKYCTRKEWKKHINLLFEYAFSNCAMDAEGEYRAAEILAIRKGLFQLLEACHLIKVRIAKK